MDNLLRPILVGRDTKMHELMIFFSTLGGLLAFGAMGFILGPMIAALFITVWEMFGVAFRGDPRKRLRLSLSINAEATEARRHGEKVPENQTPCPVSPVSSSSYSR